MLLGMPEHDIDELTPEARSERERCLAILDIFKDILGDLWYALHNRIKHGNDPRNPDYADDRLMP